MLLQQAQRAKEVAIEVVPKFPIRDKRTIEEVQAVRASMFCWKWGIYGL